MAEADKPAAPTPPRSTLKLKAPAARAAAPAARPAAPAARTTTSSMPAQSAPPRQQSRGHEPSSWADEHKSRMQADMDALSAGHAPAPTRQRRR